MVNNTELETIDTKFRIVKWKLRATVERPGIAGSPLQFAKKVPVVRVLPQLNAEIGEKMSNLSQLIDTYSIRPSAHDASLSVPNS